MSWKYKDVKNLTCFDINIQRYDDHTDQDVTARQRHNETIRRCLKFPLHREGSAHQYISKDNTESQDG